MDHFLFCLFLVLQFFLQGNKFLRQFTYFIGTVENKQEFIRETANKIIPAKETKVIDLKSEIARERDEAAVRTNQEKDGE